MEWNIAYTKAVHFLNQSQVIRKIKSEGNQWLHYGIDDGQCLTVEHLLAIYTY